MDRSDNFTRVAGRESVSSDLRRKSVLGALTTGVASAVDFCMKLVATLILARLLLPEAFGLVAMVLAVTRIGQYAFTGISTGTIQVPELTHQQSSNLFWINVAAGVFLAAALALLSPAIAEFYEDPRLIPITLALSVNFVSTGLAQQHLALLSRQMKLPQVAGNSLVASFLSSCFAVALAFGDFDYWALVWRDVLAAFLTTTGAWILCPWLPALPSRREDMNGLLRFGRNMTLHNLINTTTAQLDSLLIGRFAGATALGLYRQAFNLMMLPLERLDQPIRRVSGPGLSILQSESARYNRFYARILSVVALPTVPLGVFALVYAQQIVLVVLGENWLGAVVFLRIFGAVAILRPALSTTGQVLLACGRHGKMVRISLVKSVVLVGLMLIGITWGALGVAVAQLATLILLAPWILPFSLRDTPVSVSDFSRAFARPFAAGLAMAAVLTLMQVFVNVESPVLSLAIGCVTGAIAYLVVYSLLPGGWVELSSLAREVIAVLNYRSSRQTRAKHDPT